MAASSAPRMELAHVSAPEGSLHRRHFPSKVGGKPAWTIPSAAAVPSLARALLCPRCTDQPLTFLLQIYAPRGHPVHRTLLLFGCQSCSERFVCLRAQIPYKNEFYPEAPPDAEAAASPAASRAGGSEATGGFEADPFLDRFCCRYCGIPALPAVSAAEDGASPLGGGGATAAISDPPPDHRRCVRVAEWGRLIPAAFEEGELVSYDDAPENEAGAGEHEETLRKAYERKAEGETFDAEEIRAAEKMQGAERAAEGGRPAGGSGGGFGDGSGGCLEDSSATRFLEFLRRFPRHVLRYNCEDNAAAEPIWFGARGALDAAELREAAGDCPRCRRPRLFEFQVQPTLIAELGSSRLTFGVLAVFACVNPACCTGETYVEECVVRQPEPFDKNGGRFALPSDEESDGDSSFGGD